MKKTCMIIFLVFFILIAIKPVLAQDVAVVKLIDINDVNYTNVIKSDMTLNLTAYAMDDWQIDIALIADSGVEYIIAYKNGVAQPSVNGNNITVYWGANHYNTTQTTDWSEITATNSLNMTLLGTVGDSFSNSTARLTGIRLIADALAITNLSIVDNNGNGFVDNFAANSLATSGWEVDPASVGNARINTDYASSGVYSLEIVSTAYSQQSGGSTTTTSGTYTGQYLYDQYGNPIATNPNYQAQTQYYYDNQGNIVGTMPTTSATTYNQSGYPYTGTPYYGTGYPQQPYGYPYTGTPYYGTGYPQQPYGYPQQQYGYPTSQTQGGIYGYSSSAAGRPVYGYNPLYAQAGGQVSTSGQMYSGQLGQTTTGTYGTQVPYSTSPYAAGYQFPGTYGTTYGNQFMPAGYSQLMQPGNQLAFGAPFAGATPYGPLGGVGGLRSPLGFGSPLGLGGLGSPLGLGGLASPLSPLGGLSSFNPVGMALFSQGLFF